MSFALFALGFGFGLLVGMSIARARYDEGPRIASRRDIVNMLKMQIKDLDVQVDKSNQRECYRSALSEYKSKLEMLVWQAEWPESLNQ